MPNDSAYLRQAAAIPIRNGKVCVITSSNGKRWVIPKGMIETGQTAGETALQESWEEAGLVGVLQREPVGSYLYAKYNNTCHVTVFVMHVMQATADWPEKEFRQRNWVAPAVALERIDDPGLLEVLRAVFADETLALHA